MVRQKASIRPKADLFLKGDPYDVNEGKGSHDFQLGKGKGKKER